MTDRDVALGRAWRDDAPWGLLTRLTELDDRFGGHQGERRAAGIVADAFEDAGLRDVRQEGFEIPRWTRDGSSLTVSTPESERAFETVALPYSPAGDAAGPLVDVGYGTPTELDENAVDGGVVVASTDSPPDADRHYHRMEKVGHAAEEGAAGFVFANHVSGQLPPTGSLDPDASIPSVGVSYETGEWLPEYAGDSEARLRVEASTDTGQSRNVRGTLGPDSEEAVFLLAHYDAHDIGEGALDNGCGVAVVLGAARLLADLDLERRVEVAALGSEELGLFGSEALAEQVDPGQVHAVVNVDGAGRHRNLTALSHCSRATGEIVRAVAAEVDHSVGVDDRPHPYSDHWPFLRRGVATVQLHSDDPERDGRWERGWTHTRADTRDKADSRTIREHAMLTGLVVQRLAADAVEPVDPATVRERLADAGAEPGMRAARVWPAEWE